MATRRERIRSKLDEMKALPGARNALRREIAGAMQRNEKFRAETNGDREARYMAALADPPGIQRINDLVSWLRRNTSDRPALVAAIVALESHRDPEIAAHATKLFERLFITREVAQTRVDAMLNSAASDIDPERFRRLAERAEEDPGPEED